METKDTRLTAREAVNPHQDLLVKVEEITDRLSSAINDARFSELDDLLRQRDHLCRKIAAAPEDPSRDSETEGRILKKQAECRAALAKALEKCRTELADLRRKKGLKSAYAAAPEARHSAFLDNRR